MLKVLRRCLVVETAIDGGSDGAVDFSKLTSWGFVLSKTLWLMISPELIIPAATKDLVTSERSSMETLDVSEEARGEWRRAKERRAEDRRAHKDVSRASDCTDAKPSPRRYDDVVGRRSLKEHARVVVV